MSKFNITITSDPFREKVFAEIMYDDILVADLIQETEVLEIIFYLEDVIVFPFDDFLEIINLAKRKLLGEV